MDEKCVAFVRVRSGSRTRSFLRLVRQFSLVACWLSTTLFSAQSLAADTAKPTVPSNVVVTAASSSVVNLTWTASTDNVGVTGYPIERCTGASCTTWAQIAVASSTTYTDSGLTVATAYRYRLRATDAAGNFSGYSTIKAVTTLDDQAPSAPPSLTATVNSPIKITLTWTAATDNVKVTGYRLESCAGVGCSNFVQIATTTTGLTFGHTGLAPVTPYQYRVRAVDAAGNLSTYSSTISATTQADITKPTAPTALAASVISSTQIDLSWTASTDAVGVTGYRIERCTGATCTNYVQIATTTSTAYSNTGLTAATAYRYRVRANDAAGNLSSYSTVVTATTQAADTQSPTVPSSLTATATSTTQINLSWAASTDNVGVTAYLLERCQGISCTTFTQIASLIGTAYSDATLTASTNYSYRVRATDAANNLSGYSTTASATTLDPPDTQAPTVPTNLLVTAVSATQISVSWSASTDNVGVTAYLIERCQGAGCTTFTQIASQPGTTFSDTSLLPATTYVYRVRASDAANNLSGYSTTASTATQFAGPITYTYSYDALGRISVATGSDGSSVTYQYDANGNVTLINRQ